MALFSSIKFLGAIVLLACYVRGIKYNESLEFDARSYSEQDKVQTLSHLFRLAHDILFTAEDILWRGLRPEGPPNTPSMDCAEIQEKGASTGSGVYEIFPHCRSACGPIRVYCDMNDDGGGWTVLQRRVDSDSPPDYFSRNWTAYKNGFGDLESDFWIGNDNIHCLTNQRANQVKFDLADWEGNSTYAEYEDFWTDDENHDYEMHVTGYRGNAGDSFSYANNVPFSTLDNDNDLHPQNCAEFFRGGWWYRRCHQSNLNGLYLRGHHETFGDGVNWLTYRGYFYSLRTTVIKVRPKDFSSRGRFLPQG